MLKDIAHVRRDGTVVEIDAAELVPGDVVLIEAGDRVPADGRLFLAATLEIEEAALTGESTPSSRTWRRSIAMRYRSAIGCAWSTWARPSPAAEASSS